MTLDDLYVNPDPPKPDSPSECKLIATVTKDESQTEGQPVPVDSGLQPAPGPVQQPAGRKRGRPKGSQNKPKPDKGTAKEVTEAEVAAFADGTYRVLSLALGEHWVLTPEECRLMAGAWMPVFRLHPEWMRSDAMIYANAAAATIRVSMPRIGQTLKGRQGIVGRWWGRVSEWLKNRKRRHSTGAK